MGILSVFKNMFALTKRKVKEEAHVPVANPKPIYSAGGGERFKKAGPALRKFRKERKVRNKMAARSRRVNQARREGVSI